MAYAKQEDGSFIVKGTKQEWIVNKEITACNCPKFKYILKGVGECHHMKEVKLGELKVSQAIKKATSGENYADFDRAKYLTPIDIDKFIEVFGEEQYRNLIATFEIFEQRGLIRLL